MLVAVCVDANKKVFPLAWAIVDDESTEAWTWFFQLLDRHIFSKVSEKICRISDRGKGIINAFRQMREFTADLALLFEAFVLQFELKVQVSCFEGSSVEGWSKTSNP